MYNEKQRRVDKFLMKYSDDCNQDGEFETFDPKGRSWSQPVTMRASATFEQFQNAQVSFAKPIEINLDNFDIPKKRIQKLVEKS